MNRQLIDSLAEQAGFVLWQDEAHRPANTSIDWSSDYTQELRRFTELVVRECARRAWVHHLTGDYYTGRRDAAQLILKHWDLDN